MSRSVHVLDTCEKKTNSQWRLARKKTCFARRKNRDLVGIGANFVQSLTLNLHLLLTPMTLATSKTRILK